MFEDVAPAPTADPVDLAGGRKGTYVTALDPETGQHDEKFICDDYVLITDGRVYLDSRQVHDNGTVVLTVKRRSAKEGIPQ